MDRALTMTFALLWVCVVVCVACIVALWLRHQQATPMFWAFVAATVVFCVFGSYVGPKVFRP